MDSWRKRIGSGSNFRVDLEAGGRAAAVESADAPETHEDVGAALAESAKNTEDSIKNGGVSD